MEPDNLMPNDGTFMGGVPLEPTEQVIERQKERAKALEAKGVIEDIIAHFDERIDYLGRIDSIQNVSVTTKTVDFQRAFMVNKLLKQAMEEEKELLIELLSVHIKN